MSDSSGVGSCLGCSGFCCTVYLVPVTGYDVWRIVQGQRLAPMLFVQLELFENTGMPPETGFLLQAAGPPQGLSLRHTPARGNQRPCVFLVHLPDDIYRCGIYADRPLVCQTYPIRLNENNLVVRSDALCPPGSWANLERGQAPWRERLQRQNAEIKRYGEVVTYWNMMVRAEYPPAEFGFDEYLAYLVKAYDLIDSVPAAEVAVRLAALAQSASQASRAG